MEDADAEEESLTETREAQREAELNVFWSYIVGMLTNLEALPIERIHQMLKIFAMQVYVHFLSYRCYTKYYVMRNIDS